MTKPSSAAADRIWITLAVILLIATAYLIATSRSDGATPTPPPIPTPFDVSQIDFSKFTPEEIAATEAHRNELKDEVRNAQARQADVIANQGSSISDIRSAADSAMKSFDAYRKTAEEEITQGNKAKFALAALVKKHHIDLSILIGLWLGVVGLLYLRAGVMLGAAGAYGAIFIAGVGIAFILWRL